MAQRAPFIVIEGLDCSGKSTQANLLEKHLSKTGKVKMMHFPDRETPTGKLVDGYLQKKLPLTDTEIHGLFAANRREKDAQMKRDLAAGITLIAVRYAFSGVAYSATKEVPELPFDACIEPDRGVIAPDAVIFLESRVKCLAGRDGFGDEIYETRPFQKKVRAMFDRVEARTRETNPDLKWLTVNAELSIDEVAGQLAELADRLRASTTGPVHTLWEAARDVDADTQQLITDRVIAVDETDQAIGSATKMASHLSVPSTHTTLHRAFSLLLFDAEGRLLLQRRAPSKVTFAGYWSNTVCSHPLDVPEENTPVPADGVLHAVRRRTVFELGVDLDGVGATVDVVARLRYSARSDQRWAENEVDYIVIGRVAGPVDLIPNPTEVDATRWVTKAELQAMTSTRAEKVSPWFLAICDQVLYPAWTGSIPAFDSTSRDLVRVIPEITPDLTPTEQHRHCFVAIPPSPLPHHRVVVMWRSVAAIDQLTEEEGAELFSVVRSTVGQLKRVLKCPACTISFAADINVMGIRPRVFAHVVPRFEGDGHGDAIYRVMEEVATGSRL